MIKKEDINLVESQSALDTKIVSNDSDKNTIGNSVPNTENIQEEKEPQSKWRDIAKKIKKGEIGNKAPVRKIYDDVVDANLEEYRDYLGNDIFIPETMGVGLLDQQQIRVVVAFLHSGHVLCLGHLATPDRHRPAVSKSCPREMLDFC